MAGAVEDAARDNAAWCDLVCRAAGLPTRWSADAWSTGRRSPAGYPDAVSLRRGLTADRVLAGVDDGPGCSVKDSFADLELAGAGFGVLFEATWIRRQASRAAAPPALAWTEVRAADDLAAWCRRMDVPPLPSALLDRPGLHVFAADDVGAGFLLSGTGPVVGVSHAVPGTAEGAVLWADLVALGARLHPSADLLGYERGADLEHARTAGFQGLGPLRVWLR